MSRLRVTRLAIAIGVAIAVVLLVRFIVNGLIYPSPAIPIGDPPPGYTDIFWEPEGGSRVHGWHGGSAAPGRPVVIFFHGNGENLETLKWSGIFDRWRELDVYAVAVEYPGYGRSAGGSSEGRLIAAGLAAVDWASETFPGRPLIVAGWSLGAAVAIQVAAERAELAAGLVVMSPWTRIKDVAKAHFPSLLVHLLVRETYDSMAAASRITSPTLVIHGSGDRIIPAEQGSRVAEALGPAARWVPVEGAGHNDLLSQAMVWREFHAFLEAVGRPSEP